MSRRLIIGLLTIVATAMCGAALPSASLAAGGTVITVAGSAQWPVPGHFNADADTDLLVWEIIPGIGGRLAVYFGDGQGRFVRASAVTPAPVDGTLAVADLNGDGLDDFVGLNKELKVWLGDGTGAFTGTDVALPAGTVMQYPHLAIVDLDGDGDQDVLVTTSAANHGYLATNDGTGAFSIHPSNSTMALGGTDGPSSIKSADVNADQIPDLLLTGYSSGVIRVMLADSPGHFPEATTHEVTADGPVRALEMADVNGDSVPDLVAAGWRFSGAPNFVQVFLGQGNGEFSPLDAMLFGGAYLTYRQALALGDFNDDAKVDLAFSIDTELHLGFGRDDGTFAPAASGWRTGIKAWLLTTGDFNNDGITDLASASGSDAKIRVDWGAPVVDTTAAKVAGSGQRPAFALTSEKADSFECKMVGPANQETGWAPCVTGVSYPSLVDGSYTFMSRGRTSGGAVDRTPAAVTFRIDKTAPALSIDDGPRGSYGLTIATFTFSSSEPLKSAQCRLLKDAAVIATRACAKSATFKGLTDGAYTFEVSGDDPSLNRSATVARDFTVDSSMKDTRITTEVGVTNQPTVSFKFAADAGGTYLCRLRGANAGSNATWAACSAGTAETYRDLQDGDYMFEVKATYARGEADGKTTTQAFAVDTIRPRVSWVDAPPARSRDVEAIFGIAATDAHMSTITCQLTSPGPTVGPRLPCGKTLDLWLLAGDGRYKLTYFVTDEAGNSTQTSKAVNLDTTGPELSHGATPPGVTTSRTYRLSFSSTELSARFKCSFDGESTWSTCTSPVTKTGLADGQHRYSVRAVDSLGNLSSVWRGSVTVDTEAPRVDLVDHQETSTTAQFFLEVTEDPAIVECSLKPVGGTDTWSTCTTAPSFRDLTPGTDYVFSYRASDQADNASAPLSFSFTTPAADNAAPETTITNGTTGSSQAATASFSFSSEPGATFECKLEGPTFLDWAPCQDPTSYSGLLPGDYTFSVRAKDASGNLDPTPDFRLFSVDNVPPQTFMTGGPSGNIPPGPVTFTFDSSEPGSTFTCTLVDGFSPAMPIPCSSPMTYQNLPPGSYTFQVQATDQAGNQDLSPISTSFTVVG